MSLAQELGKVVTLSKNYAVRFKTKDGMLHPIRLKYRRASGMGRALQDAAEYLNENRNWLSEIDDITQL